MLPPDGILHTSSVIHDEQVTPSDKRHLDLKPDQWGLLSQLVTVLKPLQVATTALCQDQNISSSLIYPVVNGLVKCHLKADTEDLAAVMRFKQIVTTELQRRFPFDERSVAVLAATVDPHYRQLKFFSTEQQTQAQAVLLEKVEAMYDEMHLEDPPAPTEPPAKRKKETAMTFLLGTECDSPTAPTWKDEIESFQKETAS